MRTIAQALPAVLDLARSSSTAPAVASRGRSAALIDRPPSVGLANALAAIRAPLERAEVPDPRHPGRTMVVGRSKPLPPGSHRILDEAQCRAAALRDLLQPASFALREAWCIALAAAVEHRGWSEDTGSGEVQMLALLLELPACCFLANLRREPGEDVETFQARRMLPTIRLVAERCKGWWATYGKINPILAPLADDLRNQVRDLDEVIRRLQEADELTARALPTPVQPEEDPAAYIAQLEAQPADAGRRMLARMLLARLSEAQKRQFGGRLAPLVETEPPASSVRQLPRPLNPEGSVARSLARSNEERHAAIRQSAVFTDDDLRRLAAERAALVDLTEPLRETA